MQKAKLIQLKKMDNYTGLDFDDLGDYAKEIGKRCERVYVKDIYYV